MLIPKSFVRDLLARVDIVDVISKYVQIRKAGSNFVGLCPFHNEKTPSFTVNRAKKTYHCFGCGIHGDSLSFLMGHLGLSFTESVKSLALQIGLIVPLIDNKKSQSDYHKEKIYSDVMLKTQSYYSSLLQNSVAAISYLKKRGISNDFIRFFNLGWSDSGYNSLSKIFTNYYDNSYLVDVGLVVKKSDKNRYDRFRERIMFPIKNQYGSVVGFGARTITNINPKYLNSPETIIFSKGSELYGLWESRINIKSKGVVIVVEGYMDVISLTQHGINNVVATLGTSITNEQIKKLLNTSEKIVFSFDGDTAGKNAAWKALLLCIPEIKDNNEIRFLFLKDGYDPDLYIKENGKNIFENCLKESIPLSRLLIDNFTNKYSINEAEGRSACWTEISKILQQMQSCSVLRIQIEKEIAQILNFSENDIKLLNNDSGYLYGNKLKYPDKKRNTIDRSKNGFSKTIKPIPSLTKRLFNLLLSNLTMIDHMGDQQLEILDKISELKIIRDLILLVENTNNKDLDSIKKIIDPSSELGIAINKFIKEDLTDKYKLPDPLKEWEDSLLLIESQSIRNDMRLLIKNGLSSKEDIDKYKDLSKRIISIKTMNNL